MLQFQRITTQRRLIPQIEGLRFVAIASVVFFHIYAALKSGAVPAPFPLDSDMPKHGVELFFAISGFILGVPFASRYLLGTAKINLRSYFLRRLTRLEPPYFLALFTLGRDAAHCGTSLIQRQGPASISAFVLRAESHLRAICWIREHRRLVSRTATPGSAGVRFCLRCCSQAFSAFRFTAANICTIPSFITVLSSSLDS